MAHRCREIPCKIYVFDIDYLLIKQKDNYNLSKTALIHEFCRVFGCTYEVNYFCHLVENLVCIYLRERSIITSRWRKGGSFVLFVTERDEEGREEVGYMSNDRDVTLKKSLRLLFYEEKRFVYNFFLRYFFIPFPFYDVPVFELELHPFFI